MNTSVEELFRRNFFQVSTAVLHLAEKVRLKKPEVDDILKLLEDDQLDDVDEVEDSQGKLVMSMTAVFR